jgi:hypothetical protein
MLHTDDVLALIERMPDNQALVADVLTTLDDTETRAVLALLVGVLGAWVDAQEERLNEVEGALDALVARRLMEGRGTDDGELLRCLRRLPIGRAGFRRVVWELAQPYGDRIV